MASAAPTTATPTPKPVVTPEPTPKPQPKPAPVVSADTKRALKAGAGKRIVWSKSANRTWLIAEDNTVVRTFTVTELDWKTPVGTYKVLSKSRRTTSVGNKWLLDHMVRFYKRPGASAHIGFHAVPYNRKGRYIQPPSTVGKKGYTSGGCVRSRAADAKALYQWAPVGTKVVVIR